MTILRLAVAALSTAVIAAAFLVLLTVDPPRDEPTCPASLPPACAEAGLCGFDHSTCTYTTPTRKEHP